MIKGLNISLEQKNFILKAIWNLSSLYDFEITDKEFKESHEITKKELIKQTEDLAKKLRY
jgi:hypothetical protein